MKEVDWLDTKNSAVQKRANQSTEILFIEQCHNFLKPNGYLAIVVPDGVLTNSSLQYVRNQLEDWYRIVAVVSMPQTAFSHTGAGVKSSVLFLKKLTEKECDRISNKKLELKEKIKLDNDYLTNVENIETKKKLTIKSHNGFEKKADFVDKKKIEKTEEFKKWKSKISADSTKRINEVKETLEEIYLSDKQKVLDDYPIFMAIAEDIGYDATGKETGNNELDFIGEELKRFIEHIEENE